MDREFSSAVTIAIEIVIVAIIISTMAIIAFIALGIKDNTGNAVNEYVDQINTFKELEIMTTNPNENYPVVSIYKAIKEYDDLPVEIGGSIESQTITEIEHLEKHFDKQVYVTKTVSVDKISIQVNE